MMLRVTPIYGSTGHHPASKSIALPPSCTLIEYGGIRLLVNVGHDESYSLSDNNVVELPVVDAVLITDSSLQSLGGLPYYYGQESGNKRRNIHQSGEGVTSKSSGGRDLSGITQIYATFPTVKMGQMNLYDHHANVCLDGGNPGYTLLDIDSLFTTSTYYQQSNSDGTNTNSNSSNVINSSDNTNDAQDNNNNNISGSNNKTSNQKDGPQIASIKTLKYAQTVILNDPEDPTKKAISITPHRAGHLIGASYYILKRLVDETEVIVAPVYHHTKEKHLDSSTLYKYGTACDVLITCCGGPGGLLRELYSPLSSSNSYSKKNTLTTENTGGVGNVEKPIIIKRKLNPPSVTRDERELVETILSTLRRGGNVLLPVDASGRVLELVLLLNEHWEKQRLGSAYNLCWVGSMVQNTIDFVKSQLEWMAKPLGAQFDTGRGHPYSLKNMSLFSSVGELETEFPGLFGMNMDEIGDTDNMNASNSNPTCVLASGATLDYGPARDLFLKWCENADNTIILTDSRRCVLRGQIMKERKYQQSKNLLGGVGGIGTDASVISDNESIAPIGTGTPNQFSANSVSTTAANITDTPNIVQEDEEVPGTTTVNIGSSIQSSELSEFSTSGQLLLKWCEAKAADVEMEDVVECDVLIPKRAALAGVELQSFLEREEETRRKKKAEEERLAMLREVELAKGRLRLTQNEESMPSKIGESTDNSSKSKLHASETKESSAALSRPKKKSRFDANLFLKFSKPCHMTFEVREEAVGIGQPDSIAKYGIGESVGQGGDVIEDDYGISVKSESFVDIVTGVDPSKYTSGGGSGRIGDDVLKRGLGFGSDGRPLLASSTKISSNNARDQHGQHTVDDIAIGQGVEDEEMALEAADLSEGNGIIRGRNNRPPVKVSTEPRRLEVLAEIAFIPLEGRVDARAARQSVRALQPRQVVIIGGGKPANKLFGDGDVELKESDVEDPIEGEAALLADAVRSLSLGNRGSIFAPKDGDSIELSVGHAAYSVRLIDTPYMTREEKEIFEEEGAEIPSVEPHEAKVGECTVSLMDCSATGQKVAADGSIVLAPRRFPENKQQSTVMLSDGDVLLTDLRSEIIAQGMKAEYSAHVGYAQLIINGKIVVRKDQASGEIDVEGPLCEDFFLVRSVVCGQYVAL